MSDGTAAIIVGVCVTVAVVAMPVQARGQNNTGDPSGTDPTAGMPGWFQAVDDFTATTVGVSVDVGVLTNDAGDLPTSLTFTQPANGTVSSKDSVLTYTPGPDFIGLDAFDYTLTDGGGTSSTATVTIAVNTVVFVDATAEAGIDYVQSSTDPFGPMISNLTGGAAASDYDQDGDVDLFVTRTDASDILYQNNGDGTFSDVTTGSGLGHVMGSNGAVWGDIDNDGDLDLFLTTVGGSRHYLYINDGFGVFAEEAVPRNASLEGPDPHYGYSVSLGDYDKDGYLDLHATEHRPDDFNPTLAPSNARLLRNLGAANPGFFEDTTERAGVVLDHVVGGVVDGTFAFTSHFTDLDNDGWVDLAIVADFEESRLFWNNGDGTFIDGTLTANVGTDENGMGSALTDLNGDGLLDWFVSSIYDPTHNCPGCGDSGNRLFLNNGDRTFTDGTEDWGVRNGGWGWGAAFIDYDNDGDQDLVHTNGMRIPENAVGDLWVDDQMAFFENDGSTGSSKASEVGLFDRRAGKGLLKFDYDNDGDLDLFVVNNSDRPVLYRNDGGNANDWLRVRFATLQSAGARVVVTVEEGGPQQLWEARLGSNYLGQDDPRAHFGLGTGTKPVHSVVVTMPSGAVKRFENVPRNTTLVLTN